MTTDLGQITATATCSHCSHPIHFVRWSLGEDRWLHDVNSDPYCPTSPRAVPAPGTVIESGGT